MDCSICGKDTIKLTHVAGPVLCPDCENDADTVEKRVHNAPDFALIDNAPDFALIDNAAKAWIEAGGDADGITWCWQHIRDRVGELE